jgi:DNA polymerase-3 subunit gamma/tau
MSLYRKLRPDNFDDVLGNESEIESIKKFVDNKDRPHTYLFSGPSGCGKTTLARIFARSLGADDFSIHEINTANMRGIDTAREIEDQIKFAVIGSGVKVYIIDECHNITAVAQDALLKPLEDTPGHVYFFLCTTDPQKLKKAIHTRCTHVKVAPVDEDILYKYLRRICIKEEKKIDKKFLRMVAENSKGSPRQALVTLEKVLDLEDEEQIRSIVKAGEAEEKEIIDLCRVLLKSNEWKSVSTILKLMKGAEPEKVRYAVMGYMNSVLLNSGSEKAAVVIEEFSEPFYNSGFPGLTLACYNVIFGE